MRIISVYIFILLCFLIKFDNSSSNEIKLSNNNKNHNNNIHNENEKDMKRRRLHSHKKHEKPKYKVLDFKLSDEHGTSLFQTITDTSTTRKLTRGLKNRLKAEDISININENELNKMKQTRKNDQKISLKSEDDSSSGSSSSGSSSSSSSSSSGSSSRSGRVLLIVKDKRTSVETKECLLSGPTSMLKNRYSNFIAKQAAYIRARVERRLKATQALSDSKGSAKEQLRRATQGRGRGFSSSNSSSSSSSGRGRGRGMNTDTGYGVGIFAQSIPQSAMTATAGDTTTTTNTNTTTTNTTAITDVNDEMTAATATNTQSNTNNRAMIDDAEALARELTMMRLSDLKALNLEEQLLVCEDAAIRENQRNDVNSALTAREAQAAVHQLQARADAHLQFMRNAAGGAGGEARGLTRNQPVWQRINNEGTGGGDATAEDALAYAEADMEQVFDTNTNGNITTTNISTNHDSSTNTNGADNADQFGYNAINDGENVQVLPLDPSLHLILLTQEELFHSSNLLMDVDPSYVVLYDPDVAVVRALEVHQAMRSAENYQEMKKKSNNCNNSISIDISGEGEEVKEKDESQQEQESFLLPMKLYFLTYESSLETHRYVASLSKEKKSFERLIETKAKMVITLPDLEEDIAREKHQDLSYTVTDSRGFRSGSSSSSNSNSNSNNHDNGKVVVDVREFRSSLPSLLHAGGLKILPGTLTVGDYILSPEICVERKGISDLFSSFASGRLYTQIEQMFKYYKYATLLIEFDPNKSFCLQDYKQMSYEISLKSIDAKMTLLALAFPNLKILWSRSPHATSEIFKSLKASHPEPDLDKAIACGSGGLTINSDDAEVSSLARARDDARNILLSLPGVNQANYRSLINPSSGGARDLCELSHMTLDQLTKLIGAANAKKLHIFFSQQQT